MRSVIYGEEIKISFDTVFLEEIFTPYSLQKEIMCYNILIKRQDDNKNDDKEIR